MFKKILVANRGEIALRVIRSLNKMGIASVAVYSSADRNAPHVLAADEAILLGPPPSSESYLNANKIIKEALALGVDGIHPGYGFLSENAVFAQAVTDAGITFIGPSPAAMRVMGSKLDAKAAVSGYDIPMVPGIDRAVDDPKEAEEIAKKIGFPILIKASAGGGGKGMRIVEKVEELASQMERAMSEAKSSFGDESVFIEKYIASPRHIEIQIVADNHGNIVHLFERECSVQRRHQKVIEEAPSIVLDNDTRMAMGAAAVRVAKACDYSGAGTVEFLLDADKKFYFLEMNTRLQVEHPVTELICQVDLVETQIRVADGQPLPFKQEDLSITGHAMELRVYAEDPENDFLPSVGTLEIYKPPVADYIRLDDGFKQGMDIPIYYDPMIGKLIVHGNSRDQAITRLAEAIENFEIKGVATTLPFGKFVLNHEAFVSGNFDTHFVKNYYKEETIKEARKEGAEMAASLAQNIFKANKKMIKINNHIDHSWKKRSAE